MTGMLATSTVPLTYAFVAQSAGGRVSLPVEPSQILYSSFAHVSGVAATPGEPVASIDRLKILDTLIARLADMKSAPGRRERKAGGHEFGAHRRPHSAIRLRTPEQGRRARDALFLRRAGRKRHALLPRRLRGPSSGPFPGTPA